MTKRAVMFAALTLIVGAAATEAQTAQSRSQAQIEMEREQARFRAMDVDNDRVITRREWRGNAQAFQRYDINRDGILSGTEIWTPARRTQAPGERGYSEEDQRRDEVLETFYRADRNDDGRLGRDEWWSDSATFARVDRNRDGWLSRAEYLGTAEGDVGIDVPVGTSGDEAQKQTRAYKVAYERGLVDGRQAGKEDKQGPNKWDLDGQRELEQADAGYNVDLGRRDDYQAGYRAGFRLGYRQGFGPRR